MSKALIIVLCLVSLTLQFHKATFKTYNFWENPFRSYTIEQLKGILRTYKPHTSFRVNIPHGNLQGLPDNFDARTKWGNCIHPIKYQGLCASSWALGATEVLSDRFCIATNGKNDVVLSPQYLISCDKVNYGCKGGKLIRAWAFLGLVGVPTELCNDYTSGIIGKVGACPKSCDDSTIDFRKYRATLPPVQPSTIEAIKNELLHNGPVNASFKVYKDFFDYESGIYVKTSNELLGAHVVKVIGWGKEEKVEFWICANSWGTDWGENGFFRIEINQCEISSEMIAAMPKL